MRVVFNSPLSVRTSNGKKGIFTLNLNNYRNKFRFGLNNAKIAYCLAMEEILINPPDVPMENIHIHYDIHKNDARKIDIGNIVSVHEKFFCDALQKYNWINEDNYTVLPTSSSSWGGIDRGRPRVDIILTEVSREWSDQFRLFMTDHRSSKKLKKPFK